MARDRLLIEAMDPCSTGHMGLSSPGIKGTLFLRSQKFQLPWELRHSLLGDMKERAAFMIDFDKEVSIVFRHSVCLFVLLALRILWSADHALGMVKYSNYDEDEDEC